MLGKASASTFDPKLVVFHKSGCTSIAGSRLCFAGVEAAAEAVLAMKSDAKTGEGPRGARELCTHPAPGIAWRGSACGGSLAVCSRGRVAATSAGVSTGEMYSGNILRGGLSKP